MEQLVQVLGSLLVLGAFIAAQRGATSTTSRGYLLLNLLGSATLAVDAAIGFQPGFLLLEGVWAVVSGWGLVASRRHAAVDDDPRAGDEPRVV